MRNALVTVLAVASVSLVSATTAPPSLLRSDAPALEVEVTVSPVSQDALQLLQRVQPGMFRCSAIVHEAPGSRRIWQTKDIVLWPGQSGEENASLGELNLHFQARIDKRAEKAVTTVTVSRDGQVVNRQKASVWLTPVRPDAR